MFRHSKIIIYAVLALIALFVLVKVIGWVKPPITRYRLRQTIGKLEPWTESTTYSDAGWKQLIKTARAFQKADRLLVEDVLSQHLEKAARDPNQLTVEQGKIFLLLRVMFDVPESGGAPFPSANWERGQSDRNPDGTVNLAWPLVWNQGKPRLVAGRAGTPGTTYSVRSEFDYLRYNYKPRDLSKVSL